MDAVKLINDTSAAIDLAVTRYNEKFNMVNGYLTKIRKLPDLVEDKSIEFIEEQQYKLTRKVVALLQEGEKYINNQIKALQDKALHEMDRLANIELERQMNEKLDQLAASSAVESCTNAAAAVAQFIAAKAARAKEEAEKAKRLTEATHNLMDSAKKATAAAKSTKKLIVTEIPGTIDALTNLQMLVNIKDAAKNAVNQTKNSLSSSVRGSLTNIKNTTMKASQSVVDGGMSLLYQKLNDLAGGLGDITGLITSNTDKLSLIPGWEDKILGLESGSEWLNNKLSDYVKQGSDFVAGKLNEGSTFINDKLDSLTENETFESWEKIIEDEIHKPISEAAKYANEQTSGLFDAINTVDNIANEVIRDDNLMNAFEK